MRTGNARIKSFFSGGHARRIPPARGNHALSENMTYAMFLRPNIQARFFTPFDPRTEVRIADWSEFRREVSRRIAAAIDPLPYIDSQRQIYTRPVEAHHSSLALFFRQQLTYAGALL